MTTSDFTPQAPLAGWEPLPTLIGREFTQCAEEGKDPAALEALRAEQTAAGEDNAALAALHAKLLALPVREDFPFREPDDLAGIRELRDLSRAPDLRPDLTDAQLQDKLYGAWLGRCVGCALGKPVEAFMDAHNGMRSWERQRGYLTAISPDEWPLRDYIPGSSPAEGETGSTWFGASTREHIQFMETDDDIRYTVLGQVLLQRYGTNFTTRDVADLWVCKLPYKMVCTAETQAYRNLVHLGGYHAPGRPAEFSGTELAWVAHHLNPYREWIGAQIRVDSYGYAAPGNPELAAELAWRDARLSHVKNGIYGAMLCAAMIAAAFATSDPLEIVEAGLAQIPATSRLHAELRQVIALCQAHGCDFAQYEAVITGIYDLLGHYNAVHTNNNAAVCVAALLLSGGDFHRGITQAVMGGLDTDCNGATVGSVVGAICGASGAPTHWTARLHDTLNSEVVGYHPIAISECARRSWEIIQRGCNGSQ